MPGFVYTVKHSLKKALTPVVLISPVPVRKAFRRVNIGGTSPIYKTNTREGLVAAIPSTASVLEIGPLSSPLLRGSNVKYFDIVPTDELRNRASASGHDPLTVPDIDYWDSNGDLSIIKEKFDAVMSSHCIEHQPDLIAHLQSVDALLNSGGAYYLVIPDQRYCFDHFLPASRITDVVRAHREGKRQPDLYSVIEHRALKVHNVAGRHWLDDHGPALENFAERWREAEKEFADANGAYIDVHVWQFTPTSFSIIIEGLRQLGLVNFAVEEIYGTPKETFEFCAVLRKLN